YAQRGHAVHLFVGTECGRGGDSEVRRGEQKDSVQVIGARELHWGGYWDTEIPLNRGLIVRLESVIQLVKPQMIFVNFADDTQQHHRNLAQGTLSATRHIPNFLFYEVPSTQSFAPNRAVDIK